MDRSTTVVIILCAFVSSGYIWYRSGVSKWDAESSECKWDDDGPCRPPYHSPTPPPTNTIPRKQRDCDGTNIQPELKCQLKIMSRSPPKTASYYPTFSNSYGLPNLASFYVGARAFIPRDTIPRTNACRSSSCGPNSNVNTVIKPGVLIVGENFRFQGNKGSILIEMAEPALISGFTLIHPSKCEIPSGYFSSAPKYFSVYGDVGSGGTMNDFCDAMEFGKYVYKDNGPRAQTFPVMSNCLGSEFHKRILVKFEDNYGQNYTSIYKFEVHGLFQGYNSSANNEQSCQTCCSSY